MPKENRKTMVKTYVVVLVVVQSENQSVTRVLDENVDAMPPAMLDSGDMVSLGDMLDEVMSMME